MPYYQIGEDWDGFGATLVAQAKASVLPQERLPLRAMPMIVPVQRRLALPAGSIVPTLRAKRPALLRPASAASVAKLREVQARQRAKLARVLSMSVRQTVAYARTFRGLIPPGLAFGGVDDTRTDDALGEGLRNLSARFNRMLDDLRGAGDALSPEMQMALGGQMLLQRAGEISGAMGLDVGWREFIGNARGELARLQDLGGLPGDDIIRGDAFARIATVFDDQNWSLDELRDFAGGVLRRYEEIGGGLARDLDVLGDAAAYAEGGLRRMAEELLGTWSSATPTWLNADNLKRVGNAAQAWVGAAESGHASEYVTAAGATIATVGAAIPQPAGAIVSAVGSLISIIASLFGDKPPVEDPDLPPAELCLKREWDYNPEAWAAMAIAVVAQDGLGSSAAYRQAVSDGQSVQETVYDRGSGWWCTIDRYTGEIMVRAPSTTPGRPNPMRRFLDVFDRSTLGQETLDFVQRNPDRFGLVARSSYWNDGNMLWCYPSPRETFTRFYGTEKLHTNVHVKAFRKNFASAETMAPDHIGQRHFKRDEFWRTYRMALLTSMRLGGTVPYGMSSSSDESRAYIHTGVGDLTIWEAPGLVAPAVSRRGGDRILMGWDHIMTTYVSQESTRLASFIPNPSPEMQFDPSDVVRRPSSGQRCGPVLPDGRQICVAPLRPVELQLLRPGAVFKRDDEGTSAGVKWSLGLGAAALAAVGGGYWWWRKRRQGK